MKMPESKFKFGDKVRGKITGAEGIVIEITFCMPGSIVYTVQPTILKDGAPVHSFVANEFYLEKVAKLTCQGKEERDICPYRFKELCFYTSYEGHDVEPCEKQHLALTSFVSPDPLTTVDIMRGIEEVQAILNRMKFKVIN